MAPIRGSMSSSATSSANLTTAYSLSLLSEYAHTLDSLPLDLSRNFADLRELDAVLSSSMASITSKICTLTHMIEQGTAPKEERLWLLTEIAEEATRLKLGGEDKIRVACQAADNLKLNMGHLRSLAENLPGFDPAALNRKTTYPHVAARSFMPTASLESGRRKRGVGSLLVSAPEPSPAKRKRMMRDDDLDITHTRSPKKDRALDVNPRSRTGARAKKNDRAISPSESLVSVTSHILPPPSQNNASISRGPANNTSSRAGNGLLPGVTNKRSRSSANNTHGFTPQPNDQYPSSHDLPPIQSTVTSTNGSTTSRREVYNVPPSSLSHPSLPLPFQPPVGNTSITGNTRHPPRPTATYDMHVLPQSLPTTPDWNPPHVQQLEGPGMPVARGQSIHAILPNAPTAAGGAEGEPGDGDGDGDDRTYCFCDGVSYGEMIACDDAQCEREWFHLACIGLTVPPDGRWFCETCRARRNAKRAGRGGKRRVGGSRAGVRAA